MEVFHHSILLFNDCLLKVNETNFSHLYSDSNRNHQGIGIGFIGDRIISSMFVKSLSDDDKAHKFDKNTYAIPIYPFPSFVKQKDIYIFDFSQLNINNLYEQALVNKLIPRVCAILVISVPYHNRSDAYYKDFAPILSVLKDETSISLIVLHYNVPPDQCDWEYSKSTERFISNLPHHLSNQLHEHTDHFQVIDIPSLVVNRSGITTPVPPSPSIFSKKKGCLDLSSFVSSSSVSVEETMVCLSPYMTETVACVTHLLQSMRSLLNARQYISQLPIICSLLNENQPAPSSAVQKRVLEHCRLPSSVIQTSFLSLWKQLCPNPSISLSHPSFGDDYYLRLQERILLCEQLCLLHLSSLVPCVYIDAMTPQSSFAFFRDLYKVLHSTILSILPCTARQTIQLHNNPHGITCVENREYFRHEEKSTAQVFCIVPSAYHDQHSSVFTVRSKSWFQSSTPSFQWKGEYQAPSVRHLDREECKETFLRYNRMKHNERKVALSIIQSEHSSSRQNIRIWREIELPSVKHSLVCPYCVSCWKQLDLPPLKHHSLMVNSEDGAYYSEIENPWVQEDIFLSFCSHCLRTEKSTKFCTKPYSLCVDGILSQYIPYHHKSRCCPLCFQFVNSSNTHSIVILEDSDKKSPHKQININRRAKMIDLVNHMNSIVN